MACSIASRISDVDTCELIAVVVVIGPEAETISGDVGSIESALHATTESARRAMAKVHALGCRLLCISFLLFVDVDYIRFGVGRPIF
jgi:hypothetical protein